MLVPEKAMDSHQVLARSEKPRAVEANRAGIKAIRDSLLFVKLDWEKEKQSKAVQSKVSYKIQGHGR